MVFLLVLWSYFGQGVCRPYLFKSLQLILCNTAFGVAMAAQVFHLSSVVLLKRILVFALGGTLAHSAFCILNDICDKEYDIRVG